MQTTKPEATLDPRFSSEDATPTEWSAARDKLRDVKTYQLTTVRTYGRPHQTTIAGVWVDETFSFTTSEGEQKAHNLRAGNHHVIVTAGSSGWDGMDVILEGEAAEVADADRLRGLVDAFRTKYDDFFQFRIADGQVTAPGAIGRVLVYDVRASKAFGFRKGQTFSQTRWRF
jgi:pyridoxine/pyridoxamine 5'-phosphate oxidase